MIPFAGIIGGYLFVTTCNVTKVWCWQYTGHRLYFAYATLGLCLFLATSLLMPFLTAASERAIVAGQVARTTLACGCLVSLLPAFVTHVLVRIANTKDFDLGSFLSIERLRNISFFCLIVVISLLWNPLVKYVTREFWLSLFECSIFTVLLGSILYVSLALVTAPRYRNRVEHIEGKSPLQKRLLTVFHPDFFSGYYRGWGIVSLRISLLLFFLFLLTVFVLSSDHLIPDTLKSLAPRPRAEAEFLRIRDWVITVSAYTVLLGGIAALLTNVLIPKEVAKDYSTRRGFEDDLEVLLWRASSRLHLVSFSLDHGKIYAGYILENPANLSFDQNYIMILPVMSGHRDPNTQKANFTTYYHAVFEQNPHGTINNRALRELASRFRKILKADRIISASRVELSSLLRAAREQDTAGTAGETEA